MPNRPEPTSHLPLSVPVHQILLSLGQSDLHGYAIIQQIRERTDGEVELTASTLYGALSRMLEAQMIDEIAAPSDGDARRRYYSLTEYGRAVAQAEAGRLARALSQAQALGLGPVEVTKPEGVAS